MKKIESLTVEQTERMAEFRDRWTAIGLSTEPANRPEAEKAIGQMYAAAKLKAPAQIVWCGSPLSQGMTRAIILAKNAPSVGASVRTSVGDSVGASVRASVRASVWASVRASVWASVGASVRASVWDSVRASVWDSVRDSVWDSVWDSVGASVWDSVRASVRASVYGQHDAGWLSFYDFFRQVTGLKSETEPLIGLLQLARHAGWALPHQNICWVSERHHILNRDAQARLHCENGPALSYPDGFSIWANHGLRVPQQVIEAPETLLPSSIEGEPNAEIRRVMIERFGQERFLLETGAKQQHRDRFGILYRKELRDDEPMVMVRLLNSTPEGDGSLTRDEALLAFDRHTPVCHDGMMMELAQVPASLRFKSYMLRVPPTMERARQAAAWINHMKEKEYDPVFQS